ncbi:hypothetical protein [Paroceanicella profunda]|nr:hypothetical protein [Paroceanicella profunda]
MRRGSPARRSAGRAPEPLRERRRMTASLIGFIAFSLRSIEALFT